MAKKTAFIDPDKCAPETCDRGICSAKAKCPRKVIKQQEPYEVPFVYGGGELCGGCFACQEACPSGAITKL